MRFKTGVQLMTALWADAIENEETVDTHTPSHRQARNREVPRTGHPSPHGRRAATPPSRRSRKVTG